MPRRIPDYPDAFAAFNSISSFGSFVAIMSVIVYGYVIYDQLVYGLTAKNNNSNGLLVNPDFIESNIIFTNVSGSNKSSSMEFLLTTPPLPHTFNTPALQS